MKPSPLVTIAIPLYRSSRFLEIVQRNVENLAGLDVEILISDRHLLDDAIDRLEETFGKDPRVRILRANDAIGWVDHFNWLLKNAEGRYFMWMPHDDDFPADYIPKLSAALEQHPEAVVAFGGIEAIERNGQPHGSVKILPPETYDPAEWSTRLLLRLLTQWNPGVAFRGLFRRERLIEHRLFIRHTRRDVLPDFYWVFATGFLGSWVYVQDCVCRKRFYKKSTHGKWRTTPKNCWSGYRVLSAYIRDLAPGIRDRVYAQGTAFLWATDQALRHTNDKHPRWLRNLRPIQPSIMRIVVWLLRSPRNPSADKRRDSFGRQAS